MIGALLGRRIESRGANLSLKDPALARFFRGGGRNSAAGVAVTEETMMTSSTVIQAVRLVSETLGMLPLHVMERTSGSAKEKRRAPNHPLYRLLRLQPNPEMTAMEFWTWMVGNYMVRGNAVAEIVRDGGGRIRQLWPLPANAVRCERDRQTRERIYKVSTPNGDVTLRASQVLHIANFHLDGLWGRGLLDNACETVGVMAAQEQLAASLYANGLHTGGVLSHPGELGDEGQKNLRASIDDMHGGVSKAGKYLILEEGMTYTAGGITPKDAELIASRKFSVLEVARHTNLPPHMLMDLERATFSNIEEQGRQLVTYTLGPLIARFEQKVNIALFGEGDSDRFFAEFNVDALLRGNIEARYKAHQIGILTGILSRNEARDYENLPPFEGGDLMLVPQNMAIVGADGSIISTQAPPDGPGPAPGAPDGPGMAPPQDGDPATRGRAQGVVEYRAKSGLRERQRLQKSFAKVITAAAEKVVRREAREIKKLAAKHLKGPGEARGSNEFLDAAEAFYGDEYRKAIDELLGPAIAAYAEAVAASVAEERGGDVPDFTAWLEEYMNGLKDARAKKKYGELIDLMKKGGEDLRGSVDAAVDEYVANEPDEVGVRESVQAGNGLTRVTFAAFGVQHMIWRMSADACPICAERDGQRAEINPPLHKGCTCSLVPEE